MAAVNAPELPVGPENGENGTALVSRTSRAPFRGRGKREGPLGRYG